MKISNKFIIVTVFLVILIASCTSTTTNKTSKTAENVRIGFKGLTLEFLKNIPPPKVFEEETFPVILKIRNIGAFDIIDPDKAILSLGVENDYTKSVNLLEGGNVNTLDRISSVASFSLDGRSEINLLGEEELISYNIVAGKIDPQREFHKSTVIATLCYPYETVSSSSVCVDTDVNNLRPIKKACNNQDIIFSNGQGAPVSVTKIETQMLPTQVTGENKVSDKIKPQFLIFVENKGAGIVIKQESVTDFCTKSDTSHENFNIVYVDVSLSGKPLKCQLDVERGSNELGHIKLKDKKDIIRCILEEGIDRNQDPYFSPLEVKLNYGYTQSISANYLIQKPVS